MGSLYEAKLNLNVFLQTGSPDGAVLKAALKGYENKADTMFICRLVKI